MLVHVLMIYGETKYKIHQTLTLRSDCDGIRKLVGDLVLLCIVSGLVMLDVCPFRMSCKRTRGGGEDSDRLSVKGS